MREWSRPIGSSYQATIPKRRPDTNKQDRFRRIYTALNTHLPGLKEHSEIMALLGRPEPTPPRRILDRATTSACARESSAKPKGRPDRRLAHTFVPGGTARLGMAGIPRSAIFVQCQGERHKPPRRTLPQFRADDRMVPSIERGSSTPPLITASALPSQFGRRWMGTTSLQWRRQVGARVSERQRRQRPDRAQAFVLVEDVNDAHPSSRSSVSFIK